MLGTLAQTAARNKQGRRLRRSNRHFTDISPFADYSFDKGVGRS
jgi:hypothetical protein